MYAFVHVVTVVTKRAGKQLDFQRGVLGHVEPLIHETGGDVVGDLQQFAREQ